MAKKRDDDKLSVGRHGGGRWGYEVFKEGSIKLAPMVADQLLEIVQRDQAIRDLLRSVNEYASGEFEHLAKRRRRVWREIEDVTGLDTKEKWLFDMNTATIFKEPKNEDDQ